MGMEYKVNISPLMVEVCNWLNERCVGIDNCIYELGRNLVVEVPKNDCEYTVRTLKERFPDVVLATKALAMLEDLHDFILVKQMISESPTVEDNAVCVPALEKQLVDLVSDKYYQHVDGKEAGLMFQRSFEVYDVNKSKMIRYASRKGKKEEVIGKLASLDHGRISQVKAIQRYLAGTPFQKVWMFGSFARMEDTSESDIDLLAELGATAKMGLIELSGIILGLEQILHRKIDLVMEGSVKPFARDSIDKDKVLIYERGR